MSICNHWDGAITSWELNSTTGSLTSMSRHEKPTICYAKLISAFVFATWIVLQFLFFLNPKFSASSRFLCLYGWVCVGPVRKPHCWFSHDVESLVSSRRKYVSNPETLALEFCTLTITPSCTHRKGTYVHTRSLRSAVVMSLAL